MEKHTVSLIIATIFILLQQVLIMRLLWDTTYGCLKRELMRLLIPLLRISAYSFIFIDLDHFGQVNERCGYEQANDLVRKSIRSFWRSGDLLLVFRYFSGDELMVAVHSDLSGAVVAAMRLQAAMRANGLSGTIGISSNPEGALALVQQAKPKEGPRPLEGSVIVEVL
jgi:GGDEF domain-containing protein